MGRSGWYRGILTVDLHLPSAFLIFSTHRLCIFANLEISIIYPRRNICIIYSSYAVHYIRADYFIIWQLNKKCTIILYYSISRENFAD
mgnify:CR=1 FL=1